MTDMFPVFLYENLTTVAELGEGTRLCFCPLLSRMYVVKRMPLSAESLLQKIKDLHSPALSRIYAVIRREDALEAVCDYISGTPLSALLKNGGTVDKNDAVRYCAELCSGLSVLHKAGIVHRDVNPNNVIISSCGHAVLVDYGIVRSFESEKSTDTEILGTPGYAAPEQFGFAQSDGRTDIYALGVLLNVMLTGKMPNEVYADGELGTIVRKCTSVSAKGRYRSAEELRGALKAKQHDTERGRLDSFVENIPGLRSESPYIRILSAIGYAAWVIFTAFRIVGSESAKDVISFKAVWSFMWVVPFVLFFNAFGIWDRLPFSAGSSRKSQRKVFFIAGCISVVLSLILAAVIY